MRKWFFFLKNGWTTFPTPARQFSFKESRNLVYFKRKGKNCVRLEATEKWLLELEPVCNLNYRSCYWPCIGNHIESINQRKTNKQTNNYSLIYQNRSKNMQQHFSLVLFIFCSRKVVEVEKVTALTNFHWLWLYVTCKTLNLYLNATHHVHGYCV